MLPTHGPVTCRKCFTNGYDESIQLFEWKLQNDPCHWGSANPKYLVLGFSKGFTQANEFDGGKFEDVPFKGMRPRLGRILEAFGILDVANSIDSLFGDKDSDIAFGSLIRCSVSRVDEKRSTEAGRKIYGCTGPIITKSFREIPDVVLTCAEIHLLDLPRSLKVIVLLGNGDAYIKSTKALVKNLYKTNFKPINNCAVLAGGILWIWAAHPSGLNGHFENWISSIGKPGRKFDEAIEALNQHKQELTT